MIKVRPRTHEKDAIMASQLLSASSELLALYTNQSGLNLILAPDLLMLRCNACRTGGQCDRARPVRAAAATGAGAGAFANYGERCQC